MTDKLMADIKGDPNRWILNTTNGQIMRWNPARGKNMRFRPDWVECNEQGLPLSTQETESTISILQRKLAEAEERAKAYQLIAEGKNVEVPTPSSEEPEHVVEDIQTVEEVGDRRQNILNAIAQLVDNGDKDAFTATGAPHVKMIEALTGFDITANERDRHWADFLAQQK